jgi:hypothetical protein
MDIINKINRSNSNLTRISDNKFKDLSGRVLFICDTDKNTDCSKSISCQTNCFLTTKPYFAKVNIYE